MRREISFRVGLTRLSNLSGWSAKPNNLCRTRNVCNILKIIIGIKLSRMRRLNKILLKSSILLIRKGGCSLRIGRLDQELPGSISLI